MLLLADGHLWMVPQLSWRIQHTNTDLLRKTSIQPPACHAHTHTHKKILLFMEDCRFISPLTPLSEMLSDWNSLSQTHTHIHKGDRFISHAALCSRGLAAHLPVSPPLRASRSAVHREAQEAKGQRSEQVRRTLLPVHHSPGVSDPSWRTGSPRVPLDAQHNKSWNQPSELPADIVKTRNRAWRIVSVEYSVWLRRLVCYCQCYLLRYVNRNYCRIKCHTWYIMV